MKNSVYFKQYFATDCRHEMQLLLFSMMQNAIEDIRKGQVAVVPLDIFRRALLCCQQLGVVLQAPNILQTVRQLTLPNLNRFVNIVVLKWK
jgi:hypothetical protein